MSPGTTQNDMITKAEIMEKAALKIDLSTFPAEALEKMNEMFNGDIYRNIYIERVKDNPRRNEVTQGVGTQ